MGKPYKSEIDNLTRTYKWSIECDIKKLVAITHRISLHSLISIGSGGSFTVASFHSWLHEKATGKTSYAITPYQATTHTKVISNSAVSIFSAEGKNKDVIGALNVAMEAEAEDILVFALKMDAPVVELANQSNWVSSVAFDMPWEKDGYLATNSLLASCVILYRAYQEEYPHVFTMLPPTLDELIHESIGGFDAELAAYAADIKAPHESLLIVFGECGRIASVDIESKMAESALAHALIADFRNFAHGRHLWADRHKAKAATLIMWAEEDRVLYENYVAILPASIPRISMRLTGPVGWQILSSIWGVLKVVETLGQLNHIDPGQPEVSDFGREFYKIDAFNPPTNKDAIAHSELAVLRKYGSPERFSVETRTSLTTGYEQFKTVLRTSEFSYLVLDYDATLCSPDNRYAGMSEDIYRLLISILEQGVVIGIATGRGNSVVKDFKKVIPEALWSRIWIGIYNGSVIMLLSEDYSADMQTKDPDILTLCELLKPNEYIRAIFKLEDRPTQLTLTALDPTACEVAWRVICEILADPRFCMLKAVRSTHSWDVVNKNTSKVKLVTYLESGGGNSLCIGDRGFWPGNDFELLSTQYSLGVDEISPFNESCWNISPVGTKGIAATVFYLNQLQVVNGRFKFLIKEEYERTASTQNS